MNRLKVFVAGHKGMVGSAIVKLLKKKKSIHLITRNKKDLDLTNQSDVKYFFKQEKIDQVYLAAAKVGGIYANNTYPAEFIYENIMIQTNIIHAAFISGVKKLLFLGSSCVYPKNTSTPIKENQLLTGPLEPTNEPYAIAKISGIKMCDSYNRQYKNIDFRCVMPTNLYGPGDKYHSENSHVIPALIQKFHQAKIRKDQKVIVWGSGLAKREFLYIDDFARACLQIMKLNKNIYIKKLKGKTHINVGSGINYTIRFLSKTIKKIVGYNGKIEFTSGYLEGVKKKNLNNRLINSIGWKKKVSLKEGIIKAYKDFKKNKC